MDSSKREGSGIERFTQSPWQEQSSDADNLHGDDFLGGLSLLKDSILGESSASLAAISQPDRPATDRSSTQQALPGDSLPTLILLKTQNDEESKNRQVEKVAGELSKFISGSQKSLDIAIYSFNIKNEKAQKQIIEALNERAAHGVDIRLAYFQAEPRRRFDGAEGPVNELKASAADSAFIAQLDSRINKVNVQGAVKLPGDLSSDIARESIKGNGQLMHNKYLVRDAGTNKAAVWTGSTNFTDDAFGTQDNNIIQINSKEIADAFETNFNELWENKDISGTGANQHRTARVGESTVTVAFSPGDGDFIQNEIARRIDEAKKTIHVASMDISNKQVLNALARKQDEGISIDGIYDKSQMNVVIKQWERNNTASSTESLALWNKIKDNFVAKDSPRGMHDMMHNKVVQVDDRVVVTGSFNFTSNATKNAENLVVVENSTIAKQYGTYINDLIITYGGNR